MRYTWGVKLPVFSEAAHVPAFDKRRVGLARFLLLLAILIMGLAFRIPLLGSRGTTDLDNWKTWGYNTTKLGLLGAYALDRPEPPVTLNTIRKAYNGDYDTLNLHYKSFYRTIDYPPGIFIVLWPVGWLYQTFLSPPFDNTPELNAIIKVPVVLAELATACLLFWAVRKRGSFLHATIGASSYWLNPTVILTGSALAYVDALPGLTLVAGTVALLLGRPWGLWVGWAVAQVIKLQSLLLLPAMLAQTARLGFRSALVAILTGISSMLILLAPFILSKHTLAIIAGSFGSSHARYVSAYQFNLWWLWTYAHLATRSGRWNVQVDFVMEQDAATQGAPDLYVWGIGLFGLFTIILIAFWFWHHRHDVRDAPHGVDYIVMLALQFYGATLLLTRIHENHLFLAVPLFALAAIWAQVNYAYPAHLVRALWLIYAAVSAIVGANLIMIYGIGTGLPNPMPRMWLGLDGSVVITLFNVLLFINLLALWVAGFFHRSQNKPEVVTVRSQLS